MRVTRAAAHRLAPWAGLGLSGLTLLLMLPRLFAHGGGAGTVLGNAAAGLWSVLLIAAVLGSSRTIGGRAVMGAWLAGFFGTTTLATLVGRPVVMQLGPGNALAAVWWAPLTEELAKLLPVALFLVLALRNPLARPSAGDAVLFAAAVGSGFTVYENALYARGLDGGWGGHLPFSLLLPSLASTKAAGTSALVGGHLVYTAVAALGLAVTLIYRRRFRWAWLAAPVGFAVALLEHATVNELSLLGSGDGRPWWLRVAHSATLHGYLSTLLLIGGLAFLAVAERRLLASAGLRTTWWPTRLQIAQRGSVLAVVQTEVEALR